jgi:hypothetical protein
LFSRRKGARRIFLKALTEKKREQSSQKLMRIIAYHIFVLLLQCYHIYDLKHPQGKRRRMSNYSA